MRWDPDTSGVVPQQYSAHSSFLGEQYSAAGLCPNPYSELSESGYDPDSSLHTGFIRRNRERERSGELAQRQLSICWNPVCEPEAQGSQTNPNSDTNHFALHRTLPLLHDCFSIAFPLFLRSLTPLIGNLLNMPFDTQGRSRRLKPVPTKRKWMHRKAFVSGRAPKGPARFHLHRKKIGTMSCCRDQVGIR